MHRQHLHRLGVALEPAAALLVVVVLRRLEHALAQPRRQRGGAHLLGHRRGVEQLADVPEVGHPPLAVDHREHAGRQALLQRDRLHQRRDALHAQHARPVMQAPVHALPGVVVGGGDLLGRPAEDRGQRGRAGARRVGGPLDRLEHAQPLAGGLGAEHAAGAVDDGGNVDRLQRVADARRRCGSCARARRCGRGGRGPRRRSRRPSAAARRCRPRRRRRRAGARAPAARSPRCVRPTSSRGTTRIRSGAGSGAPCRRVPRFAARRGPAVDDPLVPELGAAEQRVVGVDQPLVAAPVRRQRGLRAGGLGRLDVRVDVGAAERVDRLLRVADQHQRLF